MSLRTFAIRQLVDESIEAGTAEHPPLSQLGITGAGQFAHPAMGISIFSSVGVFYLSLKCFFSSQNEPRSEQEAEVAIDSTFPGITH